MITRDTNQPIFYGWVIVAVALLAHYMSVGSGFYIFNAFMEPLCETRGWSRTDINIGITAGMFINLWASLIYGTLVAKFGSRILMTIGPFLAGTAFIFLFRSTSLVSFTLLCIALFLANGSYGGVVVNTAVNNWFVEKRGKAIGIATIGISLSGASLPFIAMLLILRGGLEMSANIIGGSIMLLGPVSWLLVRNWPEAYGYLPDGVTKREETNNSKEEPPVKLWTLSELIKSPDFWKISFTFVFVLSGLMGVMSQLKPRFTSLGFSDIESMIMMAATAFVGAFGKYTWGSLCDRFDPKKVIAGLLASNALGLSLALIQNSFTATLLFILVFGFSVGGAMSTLPIAVAHFFGRHSFPTVMKYTTVVLIFELCGFIISGQSYDRFGSYNPAYTIFMILNILGVFLILSVRKAEPS